MFIPNRTPALPSVTENDSMEAESLVQQIVESVEDGDTSAHLTPEAIDAFAVLKATRLDLYGRYRERLRQGKAYLADFEKAVSNRMKAVAVTAMTPPPHEIYQEILPYLEESDYQLNQDGCLCTRDENEQPAIISEFIVSPEKQIVKDNGVTTERSYRVTGIGKKGKVLGTAVVSEAELFNMKFTSALWGFAARIPPGTNNISLLRDSIFVLGNKAEVETIYTHTGFRQIDGQWLYLHGGGAIGGDGVKVELPPPLDQCRLPKPPEDPGPCILQALKLLEIAPYPVMVPLIAAVFLSPLCDAARRAGKEPSFVLWIYGKTGSRKTSLAKVAMHFFGPFETLPASFKDTANAMAHKAFVAKDMLLLIDDFHPTGSRREAQTMIGAASHMLRLYGDRIGRSRLNSSIELQASVPPRGIGIITAEDSPPGGESDVARAFVCSIKPDDVDLEKLSAAQAAQDGLAECMSAYIAWIIQNMSFFTENLEDMFNEWRDHFQNLSGHGRIGESAAWLYIAWSMYIQFAQESGAISDEDQQEYFQIGQTTLEALVKEQAQLARGHQPVEVFLETVSSLLASKKIHLRDFNKKYLDESGGTFVGYMDDEFYYFYADQIYSVVNTFLKRSDEYIGLSSKRLWELMADEGHIEMEIENQGTDQERRMFTKKKQVQKKTISQKEVRQRLLWVKRSSVDLAFDDVAE